MKFLSLAFENFMSFRKRQEIPLADLGLVLVRGDNRISQAADSNGSGKSALWSALSWVLYGETLPLRDGKVLRADEVACRFTKEPCLLQLTCDVGWEAVSGAKYVTVIRGQRPTGIFLDDGSRQWTTAGWATKWGNGIEIIDGKMLQAKIDQLVGFGPALFRNAVVFGQETFERFARSDQAAAMKMLDEIQGLDFRAALDRAKRWRDEWQEQLAAAMRDGEMAVAREQQARRQAEELIGARAQYRDGKAFRVKDAERRLAQAEAEAGTALAAVDEVKAKAKTAKSLREKWARVVELKAAWEKRKAEVERSEYVRDRLRDEMENDGVRVDVLLQQERCPTCRQAFDKAAAGRVRKAFQPDLKRTREKVAEAEAEHQVAVKAERNATAELDRHLKALPGVDEAAVARSEAESGAPALERARLALESSYSRRDDLRRALEAERAAKFEGESALKAVEREAEQASHEVDAAGKQAEKCTRTIRAAEYWVEAFGDRGLRSLLFDSVQGFLNERTAHHLAFLTAGEALVEVSALEALKKGGVRERLSTKVEWAWGAGSYGAGSAGQGGRVDLAQFAALQDLAESRSARPFPCKIFDEPECHLDARGKEILAAWIAKEARQRGTAFLTTHDNDLLGMLDANREWTVVLDKDGSRVEIA